ncbi:O-phosphoseryl-tRNA(Sec) selenium transferase [Aduncisulcus paluster]|uniref:O-phosphoseryl-tRNA(Sec) selenium transferase n=1 Tax=Aduncisulcus paluster TaxID=2918883 RepID=A0ABQ5K3L3_9EUKA|nr:O-phosphoseryl-tRNA(Sec) selenium transferase [Aduncisulcus paluster]
MSTKQSCFKHLLGSSTGLQAADLFSGLESRVEWVLKHVSLPQKGWDDISIKYLLNVLASLDSNNAPGSIGLGEREGRTLSPLVKDRSFSLTHGIGRSGDVAAVQPKAAGSSLAVKIANGIALDMIRICGVRSASDAIILPIATGQAISLVISMIQLSKSSHRIRKVLWLRMDQKSVPKAILSLNLDIVVVSGKIDGDKVVCDLKSVENAISLYHQSLLCVISTASCFAPRVPDPIVQISQICGKYNVPHVVNGAYALQTRQTSILIHESFRLSSKYKQSIIQQQYLMETGIIPSCDEKKKSKKKQIPPYRCDYVVSSLDKNFLCPVGGAVVYTHHKHGATCKKSKKKQIPPYRCDYVVSSLDKNFLCHVGGAVVYTHHKHGATCVGEQYSGRGSNSATLDLLITGLSLGREGWQRELAEREKRYHELQKVLGRICSRIGERVLDISGNPISMAISLESSMKRIQKLITSKLPVFLEKEDTKAREKHCKEAAAKHLSMLGSFLYKRGVTGARVVTLMDTKTFSVGSGISDIFSAFDGRAELSHDHDKTTIIEELATASISSQDQTSDDSSSKISADYTVSIDKQITLERYGTHCDDYHSPYMTFAASIGLKKEDVECVEEKVVGAFKAFEKSRSYSIAFGFIAIVCGLVVLFTQGAFAIEGISTFFNNMFSSSDRDWYLPAYYGPIILLDCVLLFFGCLNLIVIMCRSRSQHNEERRESEKNELEEKISNLEASIIGEKRSRLKIKDDKNKYGTFEKGSKGYESIIMQNEPAPPRLTEIPCGSGASEQSYLRYRKMYETPEKLQEASDQIPQEKSSSSLYVG